MEDIQHFQVTIDGISSLVMNNAMSIGDEDKAETADKSQWEKEHVMDRCYRTPGGELCIPARAIKKAMIIACRFIIGKPKGMNFKSYGPMVEACLIIDTDAVLDVKPEKVVPWTVIVNLNPSKGPKGPRGPRTRPLIALPWRAHTTMTVIDPSLDEVTLSKIGQAAGLKVGLLDARAIDMGRCTMTFKKMQDA